MTRAILPSLFDLAPLLPDGMRFAADILSESLEAQLIAAIEPLPFRAFEFHGFQGRRRVVSFGWRYDFAGGRLDATEPLPAFLLPLRDCAAAFADVAPDMLQHAMVTEYARAAPIGWHRDRPEFGDVIGISLAAPCRFRLRRRVDAGWERITLPLPPRSIYLLRGPARSEWEHSIPPVEALRYSITFRSLNGGSPPAFDVPTGPPA